MPRSALDIGAQHRASGLDIGHRGSTSGIGHRPSASASAIGVGLVVVSMNHARGARCAPERWRGLALDLLVGDRRHRSFTHPAPFWA